MSSNFACPEDVHQGCGTVEKPVEIVQNFMLSTGQRRSPDFFRGNWVHKILNIHSLERVFPKLRRLLWKNLHGETPREKLEFFPFVAVEAGHFPTRIYGDRRIFVGYNKNEKAS